MSLLLLLVAQQETTAPGDCDLLTESGGSLLQESGDALLLEDCGEVPPTTTGGRQAFQSVGFLLWLDDEDLLVMEM